MIWALIAALAVALVAVERWWMPAALRVLHFRGESDKIMAEPGEKVTWRGTVENRSRMPVPFVRLRQSVPQECTLLQSERWQKSHLKLGVYQRYVEEKMALRPWQSITREVSFSLPARGLYNIGAGWVSAGDLLGMEEGVKDTQSRPLVIIPELSRQHKKLEAFSGFLGDVSVRRFILEDPILTVGFRDYTGREPLKSVSWKRTAVAGKLQVKQYDHTAEQTATVLLDVDGATGEVLEECFRLCRSVCQELEKQKIPYGFRTNGNLPGPVCRLEALSDGLGKQHLDTILYALGRANSTCFRNLDSLARQALGTRKNNEAYILITPQVTPQVQAVCRRLETTTGNPLCVLAAKEETA